MSTQKRAIFTIIGGTIGVGFLALPYSIYKFGVLYGLAVIVLVAILTVIINLAYADIITFDKGNRQIPGYIRKYFGSIPSHIITIIIITGLIGILFAYGLVSGNILKILLSYFGLHISSNFLGLIFVIFSILVSRYGIKFISKVSTFTVVILIFAIIILVSISIPRIDTSNFSNLNFKYFPLLFGVSIFSLYSAGSIPVIDEIIGYNIKNYKRAIIIAGIITLIIYVIFSLVLALSFGQRLTSELIGCFGKEYFISSILLSILTLIAIFTCFCLVANNIKEILHYDYKLPSKVSFLFIFSILTWLLAFDIFSFEQILSKVGNFSLVIQNLGILALWFKLKANKRTSIVSIVIIMISALILIGGMVINI